MTTVEIAEKNFQAHLKENPYPGRGLVLGRSEENTWVIIYWIMGRSTNSRNRRFVVEGEALIREFRSPSSREAAMGLSFWGSRKASQANNRKRMAFGLVFKGLSTLTLGYLLA